MSKDKNQGKSFGQIEKEKFGGEVEKPKRRTFLGTMPGKGLRLNPFEKKELRAYLRGHSVFYHGVSRDSKGRPLRNTDGSLVLMPHETRVAYV